MAQLDLGTRLYAPGGDNLCNAHLHLKFGRPTYGDKAKEDEVLCDRIILVQKGADR